MGRPSPQNCVLQSPNQLLTALLGLCCGARATSTAAHVCFQDNPPPSSDHQFTLPAQPQTPLGFFWASSGAAGAGNSAQHTGRCSCSDGLAELSFAPAVR